MCILNFEKTDTHKTKHTNDNLILFVAVVAVAK